MDDQDARRFIASAVGNSGGVWADIGAGEGTFTGDRLTIAVNRARYNFRLMTAIGGLSPISV